LDQSEFSEIIDETTSQHIPQDQTADIYVKKKREKNKKTTKKNQINKHKQTTIKQK